MTKSSELKPYQIIYLDNIKSPSLDLIIKAIIYSLIDSDILKLTNEEYILRLKDDNLDNIEILLVSSLKEDHPVKLKDYLRELIKYLDTKFIYVDKKYDLRKSIMNHFLDTGLVMKKRSIIFSKFVSKVFIGEKLIEEIVKNVTEKIVQQKLGKIINDHIDVYTKKGNSNLDITALQYLK